MRHRTPSIWLITLVLLAGVTAAQERPRIELNRQIIQAQRQAIIRDNLELTEAEAAAFWPLYREYHAAVEAPGKPMIDRLLEFAESPDTLAPADAGRLLDEWLEYEAALLKIRREWVVRFRAVLPSPKVTRFYQLENKMDAFLRYDAAQKIPLVP